MCFSAQASMISAVILAAIGMATLKKAYPHKELYPFGAVPLFFAIQQAFEGLVWTGFSQNNSGYIYHGSLGFLFFALIFWPIWIPFSLYRLEQKPKKKRILGWLALFGLLYSLLVLLLGCCSFTTLISQHHLEYTVPGLNAHPYILSIGYLIATVVPFFIATYHMIWILGLSLFFAFITSAIMFAGTITSIWCFFAAILSLLVWVIVRNLAQQH
ncbi:hypothetical protein BH09DEP1_BH09DEP1_7460 [soil metagenome]